MYRKLFRNRNYLLHFVHIKIQRKKYKTIVIPFDKFLNKNRKNLLGLNE